MSIPALYNFVMNLIVLLQYLVHDSVLHTPLDNRQYKQHIYMHTISISCESIFSDDLHLYLGGHREDKLHHLQHVITGTLPCLIHTQTILWHTKGIKNIRQCI